MKLKDLLLSLSPKVNLVIYDSTGAPVSCGLAEDYKQYMRKTKLENPRKRLSPMYYGKVADVFLSYGAFEAQLNIQIDYEF